MIFDRAEAMSARMRNYHIDKDTAGLITADVERIKLRAEQAAAAEPDTRVKRKVRRNAHFRAGFKLKRMAHIFYTRVR